MKTAADHVPGPAGYTVIELMAALGITVFVTGSLIHFLARPMQVQRLVTLSDNRVPAERALDLFANDLREAAPNSIISQWSAIPSNANGLAPLANFSFFKLTYNSSLVLTSTITCVYQIQQPNPSNPLGNLVRVFNGSSTVLLGNVEVPSANGISLVQSDTTTTNLLMLSVVYEPPGSPVKIPMGRRVAIRG